MRRGSTVTSRCSRKVKTRSLFDARKIKIGEVNDKGDGPCEDGIGSILTEGE